VTVNATGTATFPAGPVQAHGNATITLGASGHATAGTSFTYSGGHGFTYDHDSTFTYGPSSGDFTYRN